MEITSVEDKSQSFSNCEGIYPIFSNNRLEYYSPNFDQEELLSNTYLEELIEVDVMPSNKTEGTIPTNKDDNVDMAMFSRLDCKEKLNASVQPSENNEKKNHSRVPIWKTDTYTVPTFVSPKNFEAYKISNVENSKDEDAIMYCFHDSMNGSSMLEDLKSMEIHVASEKSDGMLQSAMLGFCIKYNTALKDHSFSHKKVFSCITTKNLRKTSQCPFKIIFFYKYNKWRFESEDYFLTHKDNCKASMFHKDYLTKIVDLFPQITRDLIFKSKKQTLITEELILAFKNYFPFKNTSLFETTDNKLKVKNKVDSVKRRLRIKYGIGDKLLDTKFLYSVNVAMEKGFSTIYTCFETESTKLDAPNIKDIFIVYSPAIKFFMESTFSTIGIHTVFDNNLKGRKIISHIVALDDFNNPFPLLSGFLSDQREGTYISLLRAFFYSLYERNFKVENLTNVWNVKFEKFLFNKNTFMPIKVLIIEPTEELSNALNHFPFFYSDCNLDLNSIIKMHIGEQLSDEEEAELQFMNHKAEPPISSEKELNHSILVKYCSWTTTVGHIQTFSKYFDIGINMNNDHNLHILQKVRAKKKRLSREKLNAQERKFIYLSNFGIVLDDVKTLNKDNLNLAALYYRIKRTKPDVVDFDMNEFVFEELQKGPEYLCFEYQTKDTLLHKNSILPSTEFEKASFSSDMVFKIDNNPLWSDKNWIFQTEFSKVFKHDKKIKDIFLKVFGSSPKISFGLLFSKISIMMNTSNLEEGLDLFVSILWVLTRLNNGQEIFEALKHDIFHPTNRYRVCFFLGNLLKVRTMSTATKDAINDKLTLSYCPSKFFIHTYHSSTFNALFASNWITFDHQNNINGWERTVSVIVDRAYQTLMKIIERRLNYKQKIPECSFLDESSLFYLLTHATLPKSSVAMKFTIDKLRARLHLLFQKVYSLLPKTNVDNLAKIPFCFSSFNVNLMKDDVKTCNKLCYLHFGVPCDHVLLTDYISLKLGENEDGNYSLKFELKNEILPEKHFIDIHFEKTFDEKASSEDLKVENLMNKYFFDDIPTETKENIQECVIKKQLKDMPDTDALKDNENLSAACFGLESFMSSIMKVESQNIFSLKQSNKRAYSEMEDIEALQHKVPKLEDTTDSRESDDGNQLTGKNPLEKKNDQVVNDKGRVHDDIEKVHQNDQLNKNKSNVNDNKTRYNGYFVTGNTTTTSHAVGADNNFNSHVHTGNTVSNRHVFTDNIFNNYHSREPVTSCPVSTGDTTTTSHAAGADNNFNSHVHTGNTVSNRHVFTDNIFYNYHSREPVTSCPVSTGDTTTTSHAVGADNNLNSHVHTGNTVDNSHVFTGNTFNNYHSGTGTDDTLVGRVFEHEP